VNSKLTKILKIVLSVAVAAVLLFFSFRGVDWRYFFSQLITCSWPYVTLSMLAGILAFLFRGLRWRDILRPIDPHTKYIPCINGIMICNMANMVIPYGGEFVRCGVVKRHSTIDPATGRPMATYDRVLGTAVLERAWDVLSVIILLAVLLVFEWDEFGDFMVHNLLEPMKAGMGGAFGWVLALLVISAVGGSVFVYKFRAKSKFCASLYGVLARLLQGFSSCFRMDHKGRFFLYTAVIWLMYWLQMVLAIKALPSISGLGAFDALFLMLIGSFASCIPVPGGFGAYHYLISLAMFVLFGFPKEGIGIVLATLAHESQALTMIVTGIISYMHESFSKKNLPTEA